MKIQIHKNMTIILCTKVFTYNISGVNNIDTRLIKFSHICRKIVEVIEYKKSKQMLPKTMVLSALTLRRLMSYIYIYIYIYMEHPFLMFLDHTQ